MKTYVSTTSVFVLAMITMVSFAGCTQQQQIKVDQFGSEIKVSSSKNIKILWVDSCLVDDKVVVQGAFRRMNHGSAPMKAHIDVQILSAEGEVLQKAYTSEVLVPRNLSGKGIKFQRFEVEFNNVSADDAIIVVSAHQGKHDA